MAYVLLPYIGVLSVYALIADALNSVVAGLGRYDLVSYSQLAGQFLTVAIAVVLFKVHCGIWGLLISQYGLFAVSDHCEPRLDSPHHAFGKLGTLQLGPGSGSPAF